MNVVEMDGVAATRAYMDLFKNCRFTQRPTNGFASVARALVSGRYRYLRSHYLQKTFFLKDGNTEVAAVIAFISKKGKLPNSLGGFLALDQVAGAEVHGFLDEVNSVLNNVEVLYPMNGHIYFGFSALFPDQATDRIGFMTSSHCRVLDHLFSYDKASVDREYLALRMKLDRRLQEQLESELSVVPAAISTRPISLANLRRDMAILNSLMNTTMKDLRHFQPMTDSEWWDFMRYSLPLVSRSLFQFLLYNGKEIGFCFAFLDFNQILQSHSDWRKALMITAMRHRITRARIVASGVLPHYQGEGLFKFVGNKVLISLLKRGITEVERSYIDKENANSLGNARSKGATLSHRFALFRNA